MDFHRVETTAGTCSSPVTPGIFPPVPGDFRSGGDGLHVIVQDVVLHEEVHVIEAHNRMIKDGPQRDYRG